MALTQISTNGIKDLNVNTDDIANNAVTMAKLDNTGGITLPANIGVVAANMYPNAVVTATLANNAVNADKIINGAINTAKLADQSVTLDKFVHGTSSNDGKFLRANNGADPSFETVSLPDADRIIEGNSYAEVLDTGSNGIFRFLPEGTETFRISTNGNVGVNTAFPATELEIQSATDPKIRLESQESGNKRIEMWIDGGNNIGYIGADQSASMLAFRTAGVERVRIKENGKFGINTNSPAEMLDVNGTAKATTLKAAQFTYTSHPGHTAFTGNNSTTTITILSGHNVNSVLVVYNGVVLTPTTDYTINGTTLTLQFTPPTNAQVIVRYLPN